MRKSLVVILGFVIVLGFVALATAGSDKQPSTKPAVKKAACGDCPMGGKMDCADCPDMAEHWKDGKMNATTCPHARAAANGKMVRPVAHSAQGMKVTPTNAAKVTASKVKVVAPKNAKASAATPKVKAKANGKAGCCAGGGQ